MNERALQTKCLNAARNNGWWAAKFASPARRGVPDLVMIKDGRTVFVEVKHPDGTGRLSKIQILTIKAMRDCGAEVFVIDNYADFKERFLC